MAQIVNIAQVLQQQTGGRNRVEAEGSTIRECLDDLIKKYPEAKDNIYGLNNLLLVIVLVNNERVLPEDLDKRVNRFDKIELVPVVIGG
jgi:molybdopterin converting factor small subunit